MKTSLATPSTQTSSLLCAPEKKNDMQFTQEFDVDSFPFWSGARDTIAEVKKAKKMDELQLVVEDAFIGETPTKTQVNDFVWFKRDLILSQLGIPDNESEQEA